MTAPLNLEILPTETPNELRLVGELDAGTAPLLAETLRAIDESMGITLDLAELTFIDSSGLHTLTRFASSTNGGGPLRLVNAQPHVARVFDITHLHAHPHIEIASGGSTALDSRV